MAVPPSSPLCRQGDLNYVILLLGPLTPSSVKTSQSKISSNSNFSLPKLSKALELIYASGLCFEKKHFVYIGGKLFSSWSLKSEHKRMSVNSKSASISRLSKVPGYFDKLETGREHMRRFLPSPSLLQGP